MPFIARILLLVQLFELALSEGQLLRGVSRGLDVDIENENGISNSTIENTSNSTGKISKIQDSINEDSWNNKNDSYDEENTAESKIIENTPHVEAAFVANIYPQVEVEHMTISSITSVSGGTCGGGRIGNGVCSDGSCCSQWGWCGNSVAHCGGNSPPSPPPPSPNPPPPSPTPPPSPNPPPPGPNPRSGGGSCGGGSVGNGICADGSCCSQWGWCGSGDAFCGGSPPPPSLPTPPPSWWNPPPPIPTPPPSPAPTPPLPTPPPSPNWWNPPPPSPTPPPSPPPTPPLPTPPSSTGTCGNGLRGDGNCANGMCCSQFGWCGTTSAHCAGNPPPPSPGPPSGPPPPSPTPPPSPAPTPPLPTPPSSTGTCGNGLRGDGNCANGMCCSQHGWCGTSSAHCAGNPPPPSPSPPTPTPPSGGALAYVTYHIYYAGQSLNEVSCSDGQYGLKTRWGYSTIDPMSPYVMATSISSWNSPNCGKCYEVVGSASTVYLTAIDLCVPAASGGMHFDIHPTAFQMLMGYAGVQAGTGYATFREVSSSFCQGNLG